MTVLGLCIISIFNVLYYTTGQIAYETAIANGTINSLNETTDSSASTMKSLVEADVQIEEFKDPRKINSSTKYEVICKLQPNLRDCNGMVRQHYYDVVMEDCKEEELGAKCNDNMFELRKTCREVCLVRGPTDIEPFEPLPLNVTCRLQPDFGKCDGYFPKFYYDIQERRCKGFSYSGCGGNKNRFESIYGCTSICAAIYSNLP